ncbi:hypothetical protein Tco_1017003 [Tanacetum coccineum]|uniref:Uncharacterized protein n=1 Tax=Tanacetum coccineum TaxID=301880 RepID=A0ABQ5FRL5_9ASTR
MSFGVATLRALVHAGDKTSGDARSWYMIRGDAKSSFCDCSAYIHCEIMPPRMINQSAGRSASTSRGGGMGRRAGRGCGKTRGRYGDQGGGRIDGQGGQVGG